MAPGLPLLWDDGDLSAVADILAKSYPVEEDQILLLMGHGSSHMANDLYIRLIQHMESRGGQPAPLSGGGRIPGILRCAGTG